MSDVKIQDAPQAVTANLTDRIPASQGDNLAKTLTVQQIIDNVTVDSLTLSHIGASTYSTVQHLQDIFHSTGFVSGGAITDAGSGNINVAAGSGLIRATNSAVATISYFDWPVSNGLAITADSIRYIGVEYNAGAPRVTVRTTQNWDYRTDFPLGRVVNEGGTLQILFDPQAVGDHANTMIQREIATMPLAYDESIGGLMIGETGTRNITLSAGALWDRLTKFNIAAINTGTGGTFDTYYRNGSGGFTKVAAQTQWPNTQYDDGTGVLATLAASKYANLWLYIETDGDLVMLYGRSSYNTLASASAGTAPTTVPNRVLAHGRLIGRFTFQKSAATTSAIDSVFNSMLAPTSATNHANLSNLDFASAGHTGFGGVDTVQTWTKGQIGEVTSLTSTSASVAINLSDSNNFSHTLTENTTLAAPSNPVAGQSGVIAFTQHASAPKTLAYNAFWKFAGGTIPTLTATNSAVDIFTYYVIDSGKAICSLIKGVA